MTRAALIWGALSLSLATAARADTPAGPPPLSTNVRKTEAPPLELHWQLLALPERFVELAFSPVALIVSSVERYRLDRRVADALRNDSGTVVLRPDFKFALGDGAGAGATLKLRRFAEHDGKFDLGGLARLNGDYEIGTRYRQSVAHLEGRRLVAQVHYEKDLNMPFYGIGGDNEDRHVLLSRVLDASLTGHVAARGTSDVGGYVKLGYMRTSLGPGSSATADAVGDTPLPPPPGFDATVNYAHLELTLHHDSRNTIGKTTSGLLTQLTASASAAVDGKALAGGRLTGSARWFLNVAPRFRVLVLSAGAGAAAKLRPGHDIPLHTLVVLGRKNHLRGYNRDRFVDRYGWWAGAEYRYPIWEYRATGVSLMPSVFVDVGRSGDNARALVKDIAYSGGIGLRGEHESLFLFGVELGVSVEGPELAISVGKALY